MAKIRQIRLKINIFGLLGAYFGFIWLDSAIWSMVKDGGFCKELYTAYWYPVKHYVLVIADYIDGWINYLAR